MKEESQNGCLEREKKKEKLKKERSKSKWARELHPSFGVTKEDLLDAYR